MKRWPWSRAIVWSLLAAGGVSAAEPSPAPPTATTQPVAPLPATFWPQPAFVSAMLHRWSSAAAELYDLTPAQREQLEAQWLRRWPTFLKDNRAELEPLLNEYLRARLTGTVPRPAAARKWAKRALPMLERFRREFAESNDELQTLLTPAQRTRFAQDRVPMDERLDRIDRRLYGWQHGRFSVREWQELAPPAAPPEPPPPLPTTRPANAFEAEMLAWDRYVRGFIHRYHLDEGQRLAVESMLVELKARARDHYQAHLPEIERLEQRLRNPVPRDRPKDVDAELVRLYGPIDRLFAELKRRLQAIPTAAQRRAADQGGHGTAPE